MQLLKEENSSPVDEIIEGRITRKKSQIQQQSRLSMRAQSEEANTRSTTPRRMVSKT